MGNVQQPGSSLTLGGEGFRASASGPTTNEFDELGGKYQEAWDAVSDQLQTKDRGRIVAELDRQVAQQNGDPANAAQTIKAGATSYGG